MKWWRGMVQTLGTLAWFVGLYLTVPPVPRPEISEQVQKIHGSLAEFHATRARMHAVDAAANAESARRGYRIALWATGVNAALAAYNVLSAIGVFR